MITHDLNGPFMHAARSATAEPQTETIYAIEVVYSRGKPDYWNTQTVPHTREAVTNLRQSVKRSERDAGKREVVSATVVSRTVTITATPWTELPE